MGHRYLKFSWAKDLPTQAAHVSRPSIHARAQHRLKRREVEPDPDPLAT
jgi:hypothetical protein